MWLRFIIELIKILRPTWLRSNPTRSHSHVLFAFRIFPHSCNLLFRPTSGATKVASAKFPIQWTFCFGTPPGKCYLWSFTLSESTSCSGKTFVGVGLHKHYFWGHTKGVFIPPSILGYPSAHLMASQCPAEKDTKQSSSQLPRETETSSHPANWQLNPLQYYAVTSGFQVCFLPGQMRKGDRKIYNLQTVAPGKAFFFFIGQIIHGHSDGAALISRLMDRHTHTYRNKKVDTSGRYGCAFGQPLFPNPKGILYTCSIPFFVRIIYIQLLDTR